MATAAAGMTESKAIREMGGDHQEWRPVFR